MNSQWTFFIFQKYKTSHAAAKENSGFQEIRDEDLQVYSGMKEFCES